MKHSEYYEEKQGTKYVAPILYDLIKMIKPKSILEVGAGYTTAFICDAIENTETKFVSIDDYPTKFKHDKLTFINKRFQNLSKTIHNQYGGFDFVWFDAGTSQDYAEFINEYIFMCTNYILFHNTLNKNGPNMNYIVIKTLLDEFIGKEKYEMINILEPNKDDQCSLCLIKLNKFI